MSQPINLIVNGSFGAGLDGWRKTGTVSHNQSQQAASFGAGYVNQPGHDGAFEQTMRTVAGQTYTVTFQLQAPYAELIKFGTDTEPLKLGVSLLSGSTAITTKTISADLMDTSHTVSFTFVATGSQTTLRFADLSQTFATNASSIDVDNVSVVAGQHVSPNALNTIRADRDGGLLFGSSRDDQFLGGDGEDYFQSGSGNDVFDGRGGAYNQVNLVGTQADWTFAVRPDLVIEGTSKSGQQIEMRDIQGVYFIGDGSWQAAMALPTAFIKTYHPESIVYTLTADADGGYIAGSNLRDSFQGGAGDDTFYGRGGGGDAYWGSDTAVGGDGSSKNQINLDGTINDYEFVKLNTPGGFVIFRDGWQASTAYDIDGIYFLGDGDWQPTGSLFTNAAGEHVFVAKATGGTLTGTNGVDRFIGGAGKDIFHGKNGNDILLGAAGNDRLDGGAGADRMEGGIGNDIFYVDNAGDVVVEKAGQGTDLVYSSISFSAGTSDVERLTLIGTAAINATGNDLANTLTGNAAANTLKGLGGNDTLIGAAGNDRLDGGTGADRMEGGAGNDIYYVDHDGDVVVEVGPGTDLVYSSISFDLNGTYVERLTLTGSAAINATGSIFFNNILTGNNSANGLSGGGYDDILSGAGGDDSLNGSMGRDTLDGGTGNDKLFGGMLQRVFNGDDLDTLTGGTGNDTFMFHQPVFSGPTLNVFGRDIITDFSNVAGNNDTISLNYLSFVSFVDGSLRYLAFGALNADNFRVGSAALDSNDYVIYDKSTGILSYDTDGNGAFEAVEFAILTNKATLTAADFIVV